MVTESFKTMFKQQKFFAMNKVTGCEAVAAKLRDEIDAFKPCIPVAKVIDASSASRARGLR